MLVDVSVEGGGVFKLLLAVGADELIVLFGQLGAFDDCTPLHAATLLKTEAHFPTCTAGSPAVSSHVQELC